MSKKNDVIIRSSAAEYLTFIASAVESEDSFDIRYEDENICLTQKLMATLYQDWETRLNSFIEMFEYGLLKDAGKVSAAISKLHAESEFEKCRIIQDRLLCPIIISI